MSGGQQSDPVKASAEAEGTGALAPKWALRSKTIIGLLTLIGPQVLALFGVENSDAEVQDLATGLSMVLGSVLVIWGRITAKQSLRVMPQTGADKAALGAVLICAAHSLQGCSTRVYGADGKPQLVAYGDASGLRFRGPGTSLDVDTLNHTAPTKAGMNGATSMVTAVGTAVATGGAR